MPESNKIAADDALAEVLSRALKLEGFFPEFKAEHVEKLFPNSGLYDYPAGYRLIEQGEAGRDVYIILSGSVEVSQSFGTAAAQVAVLKRGELLGEIALLTDGVRRATAMLLERSQIFRLVYDDIKYILTHNPELASHLKGLAEARR
jgi:CRP-like cAMP-binding protein